MFFTSKMFFLHCFQKFMNDYFHPNYLQADSVLGDGLPTIEDVKKLKYTTRVINEVRN